MFIVLKIQSFLKLNLIGFGKHFKVFKLKLNNLGEKILKKSELNKYLFIVY